jgi:Zn-dependent protease
MKNPRRDTMLVSAAGPAANLATALLIGLALGLMVNLGFFREAALWKYYVFQMFKVGVYINCVLAFFNLLPLPPLDGSGILAGLLSPRAAARYYEYQRYGFPILLALIFLPQWLPGFPDLIGMLVVAPAQMLTAWLLPLGA